TQIQMLHIVLSQLAIDLNCMPYELDGEKDSFVFTTAKENPGRRPFPRSEHHFEMLSMGKSIVVSASREILEIVKPLFAGKGRDEAFSMPFVYGHGLYYLPDLNLIKPLAQPAGFTFDMIKQPDIAALYKFEGFRNALQYDVNHPRPDVLVTLAKKDGYIAGMAGASEDCAKMWQIGMDVLPEYRNYGLAAYLVNWLTLEILKLGFVPYYGTASSNIASQRVAHRAGYYPAWVCAYKGKFDGYELLPASLL
ncbi:MAG: GNAT family N-acetyltransferase, partial [Treponema sp.]|nr:GNAT family N-acetyltransferase [Treponema sp.]